MHQTTHLGMARPAPCRQKARRMERAAEDQRSRAASAASTARSLLPLRTRPRAETPPGHGPAPRHLRQDVEHLCFRASPAPRVCCAPGTEIGSRASSELIIRLHVCMQELHIVGWSCSVAQHFYEDLERMNDPHTCTSHNATPPTRDWVICLYCQSCASCALQLPLIKLHACSHCIIALWRTARSRSCVRCCVRPLRRMWYLAVVCPRIDFAARRPRRSGRLSSAQSPCHKPLCCESRTHGPCG